MERENTRIYRNLGGWTTEDSRILIRFKWVLKRDCSIRLAGIEIHIIHSPNAALMYCHLKICLLIDISM